VVMPLLLDLSNIVGGFLLAAVLLGQLPRVGPTLGRLSNAVSGVRWLVGVVALVAGGYFLLRHMIDGPRVFHFEVVGVAVGVILLWDRLTGRSPLGDRDPRAVAGASLLLAIFGLIAIAVGIDGLLTPDS